MKTYPLVSRLLRWAVYAVLLPALSPTVFLGTALGEELIQASSGLVRHYTFESVTREDPVAPSVAREPEPLKYGGSEALAIVPGRTPDRRAVRLDHGWFEGKPFDVPGACSVAMWFRKRGQGSQLGNGRTCGMLLAQGDGYWSGLRIYTDYPEQNLHFQIGRPQPSSAIGLRIDEPVPDHVWHHLVTTWDGARMRLYLNGLLIDSVAYDGLHTPTSGRLRIGFAGAGVGSVQLDVDELALYNRALSAEEILCEACAAADLPPAGKSHFAAATAAVSQRDWPAAEAAFSRLADFDTLPAQLVAVARWGRARATWNQNRVRAAVDRYSDVYQNADASEALRAIAVGRCLWTQRGVFDAAASTDIYRQILETPDLPPRQQVDVRLSLAECLMRAGDGHGARQQYAAVLLSSELGDLEVWNVRLQVAHCDLVERDYPAARAAYRRLAEMTDCPAGVRGNASLCVGHVGFVEKDYPAAAEAFRRAAEVDGLLEHHRWEARQRAVEMQRLAAGLSARDPLVSRVRLPEPPDPGVVLHVSPQGNDAAPGTLERPLATLRGARDAIRSIKKDQGLPPGGASVLIAGGIYPIRETFELGEEDAGTAAAPVVYQARPGEAPRFNGGVELTGFQPVTDPEILARIPDSARRNVRQADLAAHGITDYGSLGQRGYGRAGYPTHPWVDLYVGTRPMQLARWPNDGFLSVGKIHQGQAGAADVNQPAVFEYDGDRPERWGGADDPWMFGYWRRLWAARSLQVAAIDAERRRITTALPSSYGLHEGNPYYFFNLLEELDRPGEWYLDRKTGVLYLYPPAGSDQPVAQFPLFAQPVVHMENVRHVTFRGLTFELGRAEGLVMEGGSQNLVAGCTFRQLGANGLIVQGGTGHGVLGCDLHTLGAGGVRLRGGDRKSLTPAGHFVENCHIHDFSRVDRVYAPAVHLDGVGNLLTHNLFHDSPHHAMRVEGYEHVIELNEIHSVVYEADDQAGIDIYGNPAYRGLVLRYNFWHHIGSGHHVAGQSGIRLDDFISRVLMYGNVFYRASGGRFGGIQIHGGKDNMVDNNLFIDCRYALSFSPWGEARWQDRLASDRTQAVTRQYGVDIASPPHSTRYPDLARMQENADRNFIWRNVAVGCGQFSVRERGVNEMMDNVALGDDPGFAAVDQRNFTLPLESPVYRRIGFRPIPVDEIGLYPDKYRASWPVKHEVTPRYVREY